MKIITSILLISSALAASELLQVPSALSVDQCVARISATIASKSGFGVFATIDHQKNAKNVGMTLSAQKLIIFGNPKAGSKLLQSDAQIGYDLPLRIMVRQEGAETVVEYRDPKSFVQMYDLKKSPIPQKMAGLLNTLAKSCQKQ